MPQGLPSSDNLLVTPIPKGNTASHTSPGHASLTPPFLVTSSSISIPASRVVSSIGDSMVSSRVRTYSSSSSHPSQSPSGTSVDIVVATGSLSLPIPVSHADSTSPMSTLPQNSWDHNPHKLVDLVAKEHDVLFPHVELEPVHANVMTVRRRYGPFCPLIEVDEEKNDWDKSREKIHVDLPLNLGSTMQHLYAKRDNQNKKMKQDRKTGKPEYPTAVQQPDIPVVVPQVDCGYRSDPEKGSRLRLIAEVKEGMRRIQSHPELDELVDMRDDASNPFELYTSKASSLPATPNHSPRLLRKTMNTAAVTMETGVQSAQREQTEGPGISFLASVVGGMRVHKAKLERQRAEEDRMRQRHTHEASTVATRGVGMGVTALTHADMIITQTVNTAKSSTSDSTSQVRPTVGPQRLDTNESDSKGGFVQNVISWGTKKRVNVGTKEENFWSPTSF
ncbi:uncharacterized protein LOC127841250 isoform X2 [Dreissena polymorpha]|nr:uncharacterized protein LOC127841250 isoform X2 [Dreissena polymorpha]XP_052225879.1 uncharacterized protein LOC127841250 isoform X2 [Dreissena polymorpha]XP_052225880.1 uncharacterized protein LOC127841250 isoform X2 [Dreissena polymorpha]XP_052225881.1 uncharacterized protein LOC127841250 isoform X2 [Dreissena polymorpha]